MTAVEKSRFVKTELSTIDLAMDKIDCKKIKSYKSFSKSHGH